MGEHFYSVIIPRIKKCLAGVQSGISKECEYKGGGAFKYYELESYEEALNNCEYEVNSSKILDYRKSKKLIKELNKENIKYAKQDDNKVTFCCLESKPTVDIPIELGVSI